jgi:hypothetical protein
MEQESTRMVRASDLRDWLLWLSDHYDQDLDSEENTEMRRLGRTLEELGRKAGAIDTAIPVQGTTRVEKFSVGACLLSSFDWDHGAINFFQPQLLKNRLGSSDPETLITRLVHLTGIPEHTPEVTPDPEYVL